jgi:hypothetical protein
MRYENSLIFKSIILLREKTQWFFREINYENMYTESVKNKKIVNVEIEGSMMYL